MIPPMALAGDAKAGLAAEVARQLRRGAEEGHADPEFVRLRDFLTAMQSQGLLVRKEYDLPPIDTIGWTALGATAKVSVRNPRICRRDLGPA